MVFRERSCFIVLLDISQSRVGVDIIVKAGVAAQPYKTIFTG